MRSKDQLMLEGVYSQVLLSEKIYGNSGWVYHRTNKDPESSTLPTQGIKHAENKTAMYGTGLYCCYDIQEQLKETMQKYGAWLIKGKINLDGFVILDKDIFEAARPKENFIDYLKSLNVNLEEYEKALPHTSEIAFEIWRKEKIKGANGIIFTGSRDGKVAVIWTRQNFIPYQYAKTRIEKETLTTFQIVDVTNPKDLQWVNLNPNISNIKRKYDPEYDKDTEREGIDEVDKDLVEKSEIDDDVFFKNSYSIHLPKLEKVTGNLYFQCPKVSFPNLKEVGGMFSMEAIYVNMPNLKKVKDTIQLKNAKAINMQNLEECEGFGAESAAVINLKNLKSCKRWLMLNGARTVDLSNLVDCGYIHLGRNLKKIIIRKEMLDKLFSIYLTTGVKIIHPDETSTQQESVSFKNFLLNEKQVQLPLDNAYEIFRNEYEKATGKSWDRNKFESRARNWEFYGDEKGYVAVRRQNSGFVKLVGMAGYNRSKLKGIQDLVSMNLPLWGMVSKDIKDIAVRKGMRQPNFLERQVLKNNIKPEVFGDAKILDYQSDGGVKFEYPDIGVVVKYLVGTPQYYSELRKMFGERLKEKVLG